MIVDLFTRQADFVWELGLLELLVDVIDVICLVIQVGLRAKFILKIALACDDADEFVTDLLLSPLLTPTVFYDHRFFLESSLRPVAVTVALDQVLQLLDALIGNWCCHLLVLAHEC